MKVFDAAEKEGYPETQIEWFHLMGVISRNEAHYVAGIRNAGNDDLQSLVFKKHKEPYHSDFMQDQ